MKFSPLYTLVVLLSIPFFIKTAVLMPYIRPEIGFGVGGFESFNCTWQPLFEELELPELNQYYEINDIPSAFYAHGELRRCHGVGIVNVHDYPDRKKITIVHEVMNYSRATIENSDYLVFMNAWQKEIVENIMGIHKPSCVLPCHPIPFHLTTDMINKPRKNSVYLGGHFFGCKSNHLTDRLKRLVRHLDQHKETTGATLSCYFVVDRDFLKEPFNKFKADVAADPELADRVEIIEARDIPYMTMFENMASCKYTYLWRNELTIDDVRRFINNNDPNVLYHPVGESSMLANAVAAGCIPLVEPNARFRAYFETDLTFSYHDFVKQLAEFIIQIDQASCQEDT